MGDEGQEGDDTSKVHPRGANVSSQPTDQPPPSYPGQIPAPPPPQRPVWKRRWFWVLVVVVLLVAAAAASGTNDSATNPAAAPTRSNTTVAPQPSEAVATTKVPNLTGLTLSKATSRAKQSGFEVEIQKRYSSANPGTVLSISPHAGTRAGDGSVVTLVVAKPLPTIPNVVGEKLKLARRTLDKRGFEVKVKKQSSSQPKDTVISQSPVGGSQARPGRAVTIVVAKPQPSTSGGSANCTPGYSPCLIYHGGADYDCAGGSGDGPYYTKPGVVYHVSGSDPYGLDADSNGLGCE
jgi:hypothetical protein